MTVFQEISILTKGPAGRRVWVAAVIVALLQTAILGFMIGSRAIVLMTGTEVVLKTAPVDPRDLLRGDYVTLNYDISRVPVSTLVGGLPAAGSGNILSVRLEKQPDGYWSITESSFATLAPKEATVVLKTLPLTFMPVASDQTMQVDYGIERYYVPEGSGHDLETARTDGRVSVAVRVSADGTGQIRSLLLDGQPIYDEPLY